MKGVFTRMKRVTFLEGWLTGGTDPGDGSVECGDGTDYCMEVTLDELAEIMYRVKDAWFTSGSITGYHGSFPWTLSDGVGSPQPPQADERTGGIDWYYSVSDGAGGDPEIILDGNWTRGYYAPESQLDVPNGFSSIYFGDAYLGFSTVSFVSPTPVLSNTGYRDILPNERYMWQHLINTETTWPTCAFNHHTDLFIDEQYAG